MFTKEDRWGSILELYNNEEYENCLYESEMFLEELKQYPDDFYMWKVKFQIALCLQEIGRVKQAINCAKSSLQYAISISEKTKVFWMLGYCYDSTDRKRAIKYYERAYLNYMSIEIFNYAYVVMFNKARLLGNLADMEKAVELLEKDENDNRVFLKSTYDDLVENYINRGMTTKLIKLLNRIKDKDIKDKLIAQARQHLLVSAM